MNSKYMQQGEPLYMETLKMMDGYTSQGYMAFTDSNRQEIRIEDVKIIRRDSETSITDYSDSIIGDGHNTRTVLP